MEYLDEAEQGSSGVELEGELFHIDHFRIG